MKAKLFIASAAMLSLFAACTQDELPVAGEGAVDLSKRVEVGVAEITTDDATRFVKETQTFENGDKLGLYLMDEFKGGENWNANTTNWNHPEIWANGNLTCAGDLHAGGAVPSYGMYSLVDYIQTNYQYVYDAQTSKWVNPASKLVEGNYFLMYPQNEVATNRRDLWYAINPEITLEKAADKKAPYFRGIDNQVFLGYQRVLRDQKSENGVLNMKASLKSVMTYLKIALYNGGSEDFIPEKIVFTDPYLNALPTIAYVRPASTNYGQGLYPMLDIKDVEVPFQCGGTWVNHSWADQVGNDGGFTQAEARAITEWDTPAYGYIPYGATEAQAKAAYKYVFNFPSKVHIASNRADSDGSVATVAITLPPYDGLNSLVARVYGLMWDQTLNDGEGGYRRGYFAKTYSYDMNGQTYTRENVSFGLENIPVWEAGKDIPTVTVKVDDLSFIREEALQVSTTQDLYNLIEAKISEAQNTKNYNFNIDLFGNEKIELNDAINNLVQNYNKANGASKVFISFNTVNAPINLTAENVLGYDYYNFSNANVHVYAKQVLAKDLNTTVSANGIANFSEIVTADHNIYTTVYNYGVLTAADGIVDQINNDGTVTLGNGAQVEVLNNYSTECTVAGKLVTINSLFNAATCGTCGENKCTVTVEKAATVTVNDMVNNGLINNYGKMDVKGVSAGVIENEGTMNVLAGQTLTNTGVINTTGNINVPEDTTGVLVNNKTINANDGTINNVENGVKGQIYVNSNTLEMAPTSASAGEIIFVMAAGNTEHVKKIGGDKRITLVNEATTESVIGEFAKLTGSTIVRTAYDITFEAKPKFALNTVGVDTIEVIANVKFQGETTGQAIDLSGVTIKVADKKNLDIEGAAQLTCAAVTGSYHVGAGATVNGGASGTKHNAKH